MHLQFDFHFEQYALAFLLILPERQKFTPFLSCNCYSDFNKVTDTVDTVDTVDTIDTVNTVENVDNVATVDTVESVDTVYTVYTVDTVDTVDIRQGLHCYIQKTAFSHWSRAGLH